MKKKIIKYKSDLFQQEVTLIIDEKLNKIDERKIAPEKLAEAKIKI